MPEKRVFKDPLMTHPAILAYRDATLKCPNSGFRRDIAITVADVNLWEKVLSEWGFWEETKRGKRWKKKNPLDLKGMLDEYERQLEKRNADNEAAALSTRSGAGLSEGRNGVLPQVRNEAPRQYFRTR